MRPSDSPSIGVIVPNRNDSRFLPRTLQSVFEQIVPPDELVVVDDQSTDDSVSVIRGLIEGRTSSRLIENPINLGTYGAIDVGIANSSSEYLLFLSANDFLLPGMIARAKASLARSPGVGLWSAMAWMVDEEDRPLRLHPSAVVSARDTYLDPKRCIELAWRHGNWFTGTTLIFGRKVLAEAGGFDPAYGGLADLIAALTVSSRHGAAYTPEPLAAIRVHGASVLTKTLSDTVRLESRIQRLRERGPQFSPALFDASFLARTAERFRFAAVRASGGAVIPQIAKATGGAKGIALGWLGRLFLGNSARMQVVSAFVVMRPYDLLPSLWSRGLGWILVRFRSRFSEN